MNILFQVNESMDHISESIRMSSCRPELHFSKSSQISLPPLLIPRHRYQYEFLGLDMVTGKQNSHLNRNSTHVHISPSATLCTPFQLSWSNLNYHPGEEWLVLAESSKRKVLLVETRRRFEDFAFSVLPVLIINVCFAQSFRTWSCENLSFH